MRKPKTVKPGRVQKIIPASIPAEPEKAEIAVEDADHLYRELRIENTLHDDKGRPVKLKEGAEVDVVVEADPSATAPKEAGKGDSPAKGSRGRPGSSQHGTNE